MNASLKFRRALAEFLADPNADKMERYRDSLLPHMSPEAVALWSQWKTMRDEIGAGLTDTADVIEEKLRGVLSL